MNDQQFLTKSVLRIRGAAVDRVPDELAPEEPLEIRLTWGPEGQRLRRTIAITMRTPGRDCELAAGFLVGEQILQSLSQLEAIYPSGPRFGVHRWQHCVRVTLRPEVSFDPRRLERNFYTTSSCGVCGKTSLEALEMDFATPFTVTTWQVEEAMVRALPGRLRQSQAIFDRTGGLHAAGLFTPGGDMIVTREDVGRHNAVDKVIGSQFLAGRLSLSDCVLVVSGRASFELMQKTLAAGVPMLVAVGAPSSLAVELAETYGATLIGFTKPSGFNIYAGEERVRLPQASLSVGAAELLVNSPDEIAPAI